MQRFLQLKQLNVCNMVLVDDENNFNGSYICRCLYWTEHLALFSIPTPTLDSGFYWGHHCAHQRAGLQL